MRCCVQYFTSKVLRNANWNTKVFNIQFFKEKISCYAYFSPNKAKLTNFSTFLGKFALVLLNHWKAPNTQNWWEPTREEKKLLGLNQFKRDYSRKLIYSTLKFVGSDSSIQYFALINFVSVSNKIFRVEFIIQSNI